MLTRLKVSGFKNLADVDVRFGPFTCIAGANGVGKSNLFDAIHFLSLLADHPLTEAAQRVRGGSTAGVKSLFQRVGETCRDRMIFEVEMIVPPTARDDLGQIANATITFLRYSLELAYRHPGDEGTVGQLEILREELRHIPKGEAHKHLLFKHTVGKWRRSAIVGERRAPYISTTGEGDDRIVQLHQDGGSRGQPLKYSAAQLPRTVLSGSNAAEAPTALTARREMQSWRLLQLEPSALRRPDEFTAPTRLGIDGSHLAATLNRLARADRQESTNGGGRVFAQVANRLSELVDDVYGIRIDRDERRELLTLQVIDREKTEHPAPSLSDGSLRFLALTVFELDPENQGLICLEEPENGVHPERIPAMLELIQDIAVDVEEEVDADNPLRQVIINTHSPAVVALVPEESLVMAVTEQGIDRNLGRFRKVGFHPLSGTWRTQAPGASQPLAFGKLLAYLNPIPPRSVYLQLRPHKESPRHRRVTDRDDVRQLDLPYPS